MEETVASERAKCPFYEMIAGGGNGGSRQKKRNSSLLPGLPRYPGWRYVEKRTECAGN